ncbi:MAG: TetR family transcriptional regulator [Chloroflexota bacterium]
MPDVRTQLLERIVVEVAANGLADRSLRDLAEGVGSSHRMLLYHFGSRAGLVAAIVEATEAAQRAVLEDLASQIDDPADLVRALWARVSAPEMRPFVRLFYECVGVTGGEGLTDPWLQVSTAVGERIGIRTDRDELRLGVAVTRGLLIDVLATGDAAPATRSLERFLAMWRAVQPAGDG